MRYASRQPSHGFHLLRLPQSLFQRNALRHILDQRRNSQHAPGLVNQRSVVPLAGNAAPVLGDVVVCASRASCLLQQRLPCVVHMFAVLWRNNEPGVLPERFLSRVTENALSGGIPRSHSKIQIRLHHSQRRMFEVNTQLLLRLPHFLLSLLALGDVPRHPKQPDDLSVRIAIWTFG